MMNRDMASAMRHEWLGSLIGMGTFGLATLLIMVFASSAQAQTFDQAIFNALFEPGGRPGCPPSGSPPTNLSVRICNTTLAGPGGSGGSTTSLSKESFPTEEERKIQRRIGPINLYFSGEYERFDKDVTKFEPGYKTNTGRALIGADYFTEPFVIGGAFKYTEDNGKFDSVAPVDPFTRFPPRAPPPDVPRGKFNTKSYGGLLHASFVPAPNFFIDATAGYTRKNYFLRRGVLVIAASPGFDATGTADGDTDGNEYKAEINGGYNFSFQNITIGPRLGLNYKRTDIDGFRERGRLLSGNPIPSVTPGTGLELIYRDQHENSLTSALGMYGSVAISTGFGVLIPQTTLEYVHEFLDPQRKITFSFVDDPDRTPFRFQNDRPDRNYFNLGAGVVLVLPHGFSPFLNYRALVGYKDQSSHTVTAGLRIEF